MNIEDIEKSIDSNLENKKINRKVSDMKLSAIFKKLYIRFDAIRESYVSDLINDKSEFSSYSKEIQNILTKAGKFQKNGSIVSEGQILLEMYREKNRRIKLGEISSNNEVDNQGSVLSPTANLNSSGVKVSTKQKKPSNVVKGELVPIKPVDMIKETEKIKFEMRQYNVNKVPLVWSAEDEYMYIQWKELAERKLAKIPRLKFNGLLEPAFDSKVEDYFSAWINKAAHFKPDCA